MAHLVVVEDDPTVSDVVASYLRAARHEVRTCADGTLAADLLSDLTCRVDLAVLDVMLPGRDGLDLARLARRVRPDLPIIILTALGEEEDRILGLETGADDYITKPFSPRELVLRIEAVLRRTNAPPEVPLPRDLRSGPLRVDAAARRAWLHDEDLSLTVRELDLLVHLMSHPDRAFTRGELMEQVWGWTVGDQSTVTVHVRRIRQKIEEDPSNPVLLQTVWGVGYRMVTDA